MHIHSKFDGGKQINYILSGSWQNRWAGTGLLQNHVPSTQKPPNEIFSAVSYRAEKNRYKRIENEKQQRSQKSQGDKATDNLLQSRRDYS